MVKYQYRIVYFIKQRIKLKYTYLHLFEANKALLTKRSKDRNIKEFKKRLLVVLLR